LGRRARASGFAGENRFLLSKIGKEKRKRAAAGRGVREGERNAHSSKKKKEKEVSSADLSRPGKDAKPSFKSRKRGGCVGAIGAKGVKALTPQRGKGKIVFRQLLGDQTSFNLPEKGKGEVNASTGRNVPAKKKRRTPLTHN